MCLVPSKRKKKKKSSAGARTVASDYFLLKKTQIVADLYVDEPYYKDLKKCLQNLFFKENTCNFCMYIMYGCYSA